MKGELVKRQDRWDLYGQDGSKIATSVESPLKRLSIKNCESVELGYDLDELAKSHHKLAYIHDYNPDMAPYVEADFKQGFQKALELLGDKKYTTNDLLSFADYTKGYTENTYYRHSQEVLEEWLQSSVISEWEVTFNPDEKDENGCLILKRIEK